MIALPAIVLVGCERTVAEIRGADPREEIEIAMPRIETANCVLREYESQPRTAWSSTWPLTPRDFPSENLTELVSVHGIVINAMVDIKGSDKGSVAIVYRPSNVLPQTTNDRLVAAARSCQSRARSATSR